MTAKASKSNMSVQKTIRLIEIMAMSPEPLRLSDLAAQADMPASTTLRMVNTLVDCGYAYQEEGSLQRYGLTMRFLQIGQMIAGHFSIRDLVHPYLITLAKETGESCCLSIDDNRRVRYLDVVENTLSNVMIRQRVGGSALMHCTGSGKLFLSRYSPEALDAYIADNGLNPLTPHTFSTPESLRAELAACRERGYAFDDEECEIGMRCIAVPILDAGEQICAVISLSGPISRMTWERCENDLAPLLCSYAARITDKVRGAVQTGEN